MPDTYLLISDLDDTLLGDAEALARFADEAERRRRRLRICYASGRFYDSVVESVRGTALPTPDAVIGGVGTEIRLHPSGEVVSEWWDRIAEGWDADALQESLEGVEGLERQPEVFQSRYKVSYFFHDASEESLEALRGRVRAAGVDARMVYSSSRDLDFLPAGVDKGTASAFLAQFWDVPPERVMVAGNSGNDRALFDHGFRGIVVANAHPDLQAVSGPYVHHCKLPYADGVIEGLERWMGTRAGHGRPYHLGLIDEGFEKAKEVLRKNVTPRGFTACSVEDDRDPNSNYRSVWARDSAMTLMWALPLGDPELIECARASLETILGAQTKDGHLPNYVDVASGEPEFGGIGNICGIDSAMWAIIASWNYAHVTGDHDFLRRWYKPLHKTMKWLRAHDSNNCGLIEVPEAADWCDLFPRSYNVLYDEVLWYRANVDFIEIRKVCGEPVERYEERSERIRGLINRWFWPTLEQREEGWLTHANTQYNVGQTRYLIAQITPFDFSWRCDVFGNILAGLYGVLTPERAHEMMRFVRQVGADTPYPVRVLYPSIQPGDPDWRDYLLVKLQNLPDHYHNGGIWPFVGGLWVRLLLRLGERATGSEALRRLAELCQAGVERPWEFTEWAHGRSGRPMGKAYQAWSAASYVAAYMALQGETSLEVDE